MTMKELEMCIEVYGRDIYTFCVWLAKNQEYADDLYQDTFLTAIEVIDRIDSEENMKSYLLSISIHIWKNRKRKWAWRNRVAPTVEITEDFNVDLVYEEKDSVLEGKKSAVLQRRSIGGKKVCSQFRTGHGNSRDLRIIGNMTLLSVFVDLSIKERLKVMPLLYLLAFIFSLHFYCRHLIIGFDRGALSADIVIIE